MNIRFFLFVIFFSFSSFVFSKINDPIVDLNKITNETLIKLNNCSSAVLEDNKFIENVILENILPYVDFDEMSLWIVGKKIWFNSSDIEKDNFINEFKNLIINVYINTLKEYIGGVVVFFPNNKFSGSKSIQKRIQISSEVHQLSGKNISVDYRLVLKNDYWLIYDLIVDGISFLKGFQIQFSDDIKKEGLNFVINKMKNSKNG